MRMLILAAGLMLAACGTVPAVPPSPSIVAETTVLDEKVAVEAEYTYKTMRIAIEKLVDAGIIRGPMATKVAEIDRRAYRALRAARAAYKAGNAASYEAALSQAEAAVADLLSVVKG